MAVTIRLSRRGRRKQPFYRIIAADKAMKRDGRFLEMLGTYNTLVDPPAIDLKEDRVKYWISVGAIPSDTVASIMERQNPGYLKGITEARKAKITSRRLARKSRSKGAKAEKSAAKIRRKSKGSDKKAATA